MDVDEESKE
jgi:hypothetical protein